MLLTMTHSSETVCNSLLVEQFYTFIHTDASFSGGTDSNTYAIYGGSIYGGSERCGATGLL